MSEYPVWILSILDMFNENLTCVSYVHQYAYDEENTFHYLRMAPDATEIYGGDRDGEVVSPPFLFSVRNFMKSMEPYGILSDLALNTKDTVIDENSPPSSLLMEFKVKVINEDLCLYDEDLDELDDGESLYNFCLILFLEHPEDRDPGARINIYTQKTERIE